MEGEEERDGKRVKGIGREEEEGTEERKERGGENSIGRRVR